MIATLVRGVCATSGALLIAGTLGASTITLDENGNGNVNGTPLTYNANATNPNPPGQHPVLEYTLPFSGVAGDVELIEPETGLPGDVLQFLGNGNVIYYSQPSSANTLAERYFPPIPPAGVPNTVRINEGTNGAALYTPTAGQPGYDVSGPTYDFISDAPSTSTVPEPATDWVVGAFGILFGIVSWRKRRV